MGGEVQLAWGTHVRTWNKRTENNSTRQARTRANSDSRGLKTEGIYSTSELKERWFCHLLAILNRADSLFMGGG